MSIKYSLVLFALLAFVPCFTHKLRPNLSKNVHTMSMGMGCTPSFKDCGSAVGSLKSVSINGTCSSGIAMLKKGTSLVIDFSFSSANDEDNLTSKVYGKIGDFPFVKFPLDNPNACVNSGLTCPIKGGAQQDYLPVLAVLQSYPSVNVIVKWELQNKKGEDVFCALIPATIIS